jgi:hypothetical protein
MLVENYSFPRCPRMTMTRTTQTSTSKINVMSEPKSEQAKYGSVLTGLGSKFALKKDQFPRTLTHVTSILSDHKF